MTLSMNSALNRPEGVGWSPKTTFVSCFQSLSPTATKSSSASAGLLFDCAHACSGKKFADSNCLY